MESHLVPIGDLRPNTAPPQNKTIRAIVTLAWPYSSLTRQSTLLLAERDFRLRRNKGQVRVCFNGASGSAIAKQQLRIGDEVILALKGAKWNQVSTQAQAMTPGKSVEGELEFNGQLEIQVRSKDEFRHISIDEEVGSVDTGDGNELLVSSVQQVSHPAVYQTPIKPRWYDESIFASPSIKRRSLAATDLPKDNLYDLLSDDEILSSERERKRRRTTFGEIKEWRYSPETLLPREISGVDATDTLPEPKSHVVPGPQHLTHDLTTPTHTRSAAPYVAAASDLRASSIHERKIPLTITSKDTRAKALGLQRSTNINPSQDLDTSKAHNNGLTTRELISEDLTRSSALTQVEKKSFLSQSSAIHDHDPQPLHSETTPDSNIAPLHSSLLDHTVLSGAPFSDQGLKMGVLTDGTVDQRSKDATVFKDHGSSIAQTGSDNSHPARPEQPLHDLAVEAKSPVSAKMSKSLRTSGVVSSTAKPPETAPESEKEKLMAQTYDSLFGFHFSPSPHGHYPGHDVMLSVPQTDLNRSAEKMLEILPSRAADRKSTPDVRISNSSIGSVAPAQATESVFDKHLMTPSSTQLTSNNERLLTEAHLKGSPPHSQTLEDSLEQQLATPQSSSHSHHFVEESITARVNEGHGQTVSEASEERALVEQNSAGIGQPSLAVEDPHMNPFLPHGPETLVERQGSLASLTSLREDDNPALMASDINIAEPYDTGTGNPSLRESALSVLKAPGQTSLNINYAGNQLSRNLTAYDLPPSVVNGQQTREDTKSSAPDQEQVSIQKDMLESHSQERPALNPGKEERHPATQPDATSPKVSLKTRISEVPDVVQTWFSPRRTGQLRPLANVNKAEDVNTAADPETKLDVSNSMHGITTELAYFVSLSKIPERLNAPSHGPGNTVDVLAVVVDETKEPKRAPAGPKDYHTVLRIIDPSLQQGVSIAAHIFRPWQAKLPAARVGDVILLRSFVVKSRNRQPYLLSGDASAWCVWRYSLASTSEHDVISGQGQKQEPVTREEIKGPPVEMGDNERKRAQDLRRWWQDLPTPAVSSSG